MRVLERFRLKCRHLRIVRGGVFLRKTPFGLKVSFRSRFETAVPLTIGILVLALGGMCNAQTGNAGEVASSADAHSQPIHQTEAPIPPLQLVREVVYNELHDHEGHGYWRYWIQRRTPKEIRLENQIETAQGPVTWLAMTNGQPVSTEAQQQDEARLKHLLTSPEEQARHLRDYREDEERIGRIVGLLPEAFIFQYAGEENGCHKLTFHPNPDYPAHTIEARVLHSMSGTLWVDGRMKRMTRLDAHVEENLDFGFGFLGRLYKGGWFRIERTQVNATDWKTERLEVHMSGRALMVKSFARETSEVRGGFVPVPAGMNLAQGMALMQQTDAQSKLNSKPQSKGLVAPNALALRR
jgi:hypothetical protein